MFSWVNNIVTASVAQSCPTVVTPCTAAHQAPLSMELSRQEYWSRLPFPSPGDLPNPGIEPASPALAGGFFTPEPQGKDIQIMLFYIKSILIVRMPKMFLEKKYNVVLLIQ